MTTTMHDFSRTVTFDGKEPLRKPNELVNHYQEVLDDRRLNWTGHHHFLKMLGAGGQGVVYLTERRGADGFTLPVALKVFSPEPYETCYSYEDAMARIAGVAARVAQIQQDNLLDVHNFVDRNRIRMMFMEWIDGYDLSQLLVPLMLEKIRGRVSMKRWEEINRVVVTQGPVHPRIKPGVAIAIVRDCLAALGALHRDGILHGDIKPSNIMLKRTGNAKIIDIGSAFDLGDPPPQRTCTPRYAAPEVLDGRDCAPQSDLASLGYVLVEMLSGRPVFTRWESNAELLKQKHMLPHQLDSILPGDVTCNDLLMSFCRGLIAPDPQRRFESAERADLVQEGAAAFHRQLVMSDLSSEYENEIRVWIQELKEMEEAERKGR